MTPFSKSVLATSRAAEAGDAFPPGGEFEAELRVALDALLSDGGVLGDAGVAEEETLEAWGDGVLVFDEGGHVVEGVA